MHYVFCINIVQSRVIDLLVICAFVLVEAVWHPLYYPSAAKGIEKFASTCTKDSTRGLNHVVPLIQFVGSSVWSNSSWSLSKGVLSVDGNRLYLSRSSNTVKF